MARFVYGYFGADLPPGYTPVGPQYQVGQEGPAGGTVVSITPGPVPTAMPAGAPVPMPMPMPMPGAVAMPKAVSVPTAATPAPGVLPANYYPQVSVGESWATWMRRGSSGAAPAPVAQAVDTGLITTVDMAQGPTNVSVYIAPVAKPEIVAGPEGKPVVVVPRDQISNLPTVPARVMPSRVPGDTEPLSYSPKMWANFFEFPDYRQLPVNALPLTDAARQAQGGARDATPTTDLIVTAAGVFDREGRPYPEVQPLRTLPTAEAGPGGLVQAKQGTPTARDASVQTTGTVLVEGAAGAAGGASSTPISPAPPHKKATSLVPLVAGVGAGFLVGGPLGAGVGAVAVLILGKK